MARARTKSFSSHTQKPTWAPPAIWVKEHWLSPRPGSAVVRACMLGSWLHLRQKQPLLYIIWNLRGHCSTSVFLRGGLSQDTWTALVLNIFVNCEFWGWGEDIWERSISQDMGLIFISSFSAYFQHEVTESEWEQRWRGDGRSVLAYWSQNNQKTLLCLGSLMTGFMWEFLSWNCISHGF